MEQAIFIGSLNMENVQTVKYTVQLHAVQTNLQQPNTCNLYVFILLISFESLHYEQHDKRDGKFMDNMDEEIGKTVHIVNHVRHLIAQVE